MLVGMDEVGRGALAGPVTVGVVMVDLATPTAPQGLRDSKLLTPEARERLAPRIRRWVPRHGVGHATPEEIDAYGILRALRLAGQRALAQLPEPPDIVLLDGSYDWLRRPASCDQLGLFDVGPELADPPDDETTYAVVTQVKADLRCAAVAAASVLAKVTRDAMMLDRAPRHPVYGWEVNKGYATPEHREAIRRYGPCTWHRRTWNLLAAEPAALALAEEDTMDLSDPMAAWTELEEVAGA